MKPDRIVETGNVPFPDVIAPFLRACPGPPVAIKALRLVAHQPIEGIPGLEPEPGLTGLGSDQHRSRPARLRALNEVARAVFYSADHLSKQARRYGYSISLPIRWITFLQGCALREQGARGGRIAEHLGLSDATSWSRFVKNLTGRTPTQLPHLPLSDWVVEGRRRVFLEPHR